MLQITRQGVIPVSSEELDRQRQQFIRAGYVHLHSFIDRPLAEELASLVNKANFTRRLTPNIGCVESCDAAQINVILNKALSQPAVMSAVSRIYTDTPLQFFRGNVVRRIPGEGHFSRWHNDASAPIEHNGHKYPRVVALSLNLSPAGFEGGELELGTLPSGIPVTMENAQKIGAEIQLENLESVANEGFGDALLFAIANNRFHRVADVTGGGPRTVFVGWYHTVL